MLLLAHRTPTYLAITSAHGAVATVAILAGAIALATRKGGAGHRRSGRAYWMAIGAVAASGAGMMLIGAWSVRLLVLLGLTSQATWSGVRVLHRRRPDLYPADRAAPVDWCTAAAALAIGVGALVAVEVGVEPANATAIVSTAPALIAYGAYDLARFAAPAAWPMRPRLWLGEHVVKMCGSYFGALSAFAGSTLTVVPMPWRILVPNALGFAAMGYFLRRLRRRSSPRVSARRPLPTVVRA